jgi:hypothetical protein
MLLVHQLHSLGRRERSTCATALEHWPAQHERRANRHGDQEKVILI